MNIPFVDLKAQYAAYKTEIDGAIASVIADSAFINGKYVSQFEKEFAQYLGIKHAIGCANGTDSIEILLQAHGIGRGDEVIVPAHSWFSTSEAVSAIGATVIFADVLPNRYTIDPLSIKAKITTKTRAIIPVHLYGYAAMMDEVMAIAQEYGLVVVEDCAQAHGALYRDKVVGTIGHSASFSFFPGKNLGAYGDAGGMVTNDDAVAEKARMIAQHGQKGKHNHLIEGRNSRLDGLHAAILSAKLPHLESWNKARRQIAEWYFQYLDEANIVLPDRPNYTTPAFHLFVVQIENRAQVMADLKSAGIETAIHYPTALPFLKAYAHRGYQTTDFPVAAAQSERLLSLPIFPEMTEEQVCYVAEHLNKSIAQ